MVADVIATARLDLLALEPAILALIERDDGAAVEHELSVRLPAGWTQTIPARLRLEQLAADPSEQPWLVRAIVLRRNGRVVGSVGFHDPPDQHGRVEIGYDVVPAERRSGYAREAVLGLTAWAYATKRARTCRVSITPDNMPSLALARSLGFRHVGERMDDVDGRELVLERPLPLDGY
jgi:[ribosomal protein S5]-alanine N-acetyltransferase